MLEGQAHWKIASSSPAVHRGRSMQPSDREFLENSPA